MNTQIYHLTLVVQTETISPNVVSFWTGKSKFPQSSLFLVLDRWQSYHPWYLSQAIRCESCFFVVMRFRYRHCCVSVAMWSSDYFTSPQLAPRAIWDTCCKPWCVAYLLCSTAIRRDIRAAWYFCSCELPCCSDECVYSTVSFFATPNFHCVLSICQRK